MTGKHPPPVGGRTWADHLRDDLRRCEDWVTRIGVGQSAADEKADALALLKLLDKVADEMERLEARGVDLRAERSRFDTLLARLRRRAGAVAAQLGDALAANRPPDARWWWYVDEKAAADRRGRLKRIGLGILAGLGLLALAFVFYDRVLAPAPHIRQANAHFSNGEESALQGDLAAAIEQFEAAKTLDPERWDAYLWLGVLYDTTDDTERAATAFERGRAFFEDDAEFLLQRGTLYLLVENTESAHQDALTAIEQSPDLPEGYFLLGSVAEETNDWELAAASFHRAAQLAEQTGPIDLEVSARVRLGNAMQMLGALPSTEPTP